MSKDVSIKDLERKIRATKTYDDWVDRNKGVACLGCGGTENLECHHVPELYSILRSLWKVYENEDETLAHVLAMHEGDRCECVTFCSTCHSKKHPCRYSRVYHEPVAVANWTAIPRKLGIPFSHSTATLTKHSLGLVSFQLLLAIGWYILNGHVNSKMLYIHRRRLAQLIGKTPGTSFNRSLDKAILSLSTLGILLAAHRHGNDMELHLSPKYLEDLSANPWFMSLDEVPTNSMCVLTLRWFLGTQSNRRSYSIGLDKLKIHLGITVSNMRMAAHAIRKACKKISWANVEIEKGMCRFVLSRKGSKPVFSLRDTIKDSVTQAR